MVPRNSGTMMSVNAFIADSLSADHSVGVRGETRRLLWGGPSAVW